MNIKKKYVGFKKNINKRGLIFQYKIRSDPMFGIGYVAVRRIPCSCHACLSELSYPWNIRKDKYNRDQYKGIKTVYHWPILG